MGLLLGALLGAGCEADDVVVAEPAPASSSPAGGAPVACASNDDCALNELCEKASCGAASGSCARRPLMCDPAEAPVCGCDGVTYWTDCLRRQSGVLSAQPGECPTGLSCDNAGASACPAGSSCARLLPSDAPCGAMAPGACWMLPPFCPSDPEADHWVACGPPAGCLPTCDAIRAGQPARRLLGPHCP